MDRLSVWQAIFERDEKRVADEPKKTKRFFTREISGSVTERVKRMRSLRFFQFTKSLTYLIAHISTRAYGTALLCFGLLGALMYFLGVSADMSVTTPIIGILLSCLAIPFLLSDKPLPILLQDFKPTDYLFFEFFCMKRHSVMESERKFPLFLSILIGFGAAALTVLFPLWQVALAIGIIIFVYIGMESPEFIFLTSLFCLPYIRFLPRAEIVFAIAIILAIISFMRKVAYGRRVLYLEQYDIILGMLLLFILISGIFVKGVESFSGAVKMIVFALGYTLAGNIITNRRLADLSASSIVLSGALASIVSVAQLVRTGLGGDVTADNLAHLLAREDGVAAFLMVAMMFSFGLIRQSQGSSRGLFTVAAVLCLLGLVISGEYLAITSLILGGLAYLIIKSNKITAILLPLLLAVSVLVFLLPADLLDLVFTYSPSVVSAEELFDLWEKSAQLLSSNIALGIGIGRESFISEIASLGITGHLDSSNLFIELALEAGILAFISFMLILIVRLRHRSMQYIYVRNSQIERMSNLSGACLFSLLAFGMVNYIWSDMSAYYLFWCVFGMGSASLRVAKRDYDDRVIYYEESSALDSSVIDIEIG